MLREKGALTFQMDIIPKVIFIARLDFEFDLHDVAVKNISHHAIVNFIW